MKFPYYSLSYKISHTAKSLGGGWGMWADGQASITSSLSFVLYIWCVLVIVCSSNVAVGTRNERTRYRVRQQDDEDVAGDGRIQPLAAEKCTYYSQVKQMVAENFVNTKPMMSLSHPITCRKSRLHYHLQSSTSSISFPSNLQCPSSVPSPHPPYASSIHPAPTPPTTSKEVPAVSAKTASVSSHSYSSS